MLNAIWHWWQFNFWFGMACLVAGIGVVSPFLLSKRFRKWMNRNEVDLEAIGLAVLVLAVVVIGLYNRFGPGAA